MGRSALPNACSIGADDQVRTDVRLGVTLLPAVKLIMPSGDGAWRTFEQMFGKVFVSLRASVPARTPLRGSPVWPVARA
jgi:hypothetical protein